MHRCPIHNIKFVISWHNVFFILSYRTFKLSDYHRRWQLIFCKTNNQLISKTLNKTWVTAIKAFLILQANWELIKKNALITIMVELCQTLRVHWNLIRNNVADAFAKHFSINSLTHTHTRARYSSGHAPSHARTHACTDTDTHTPHSTLTVRCAGEDCNTCTHKLTSNSPACVVAPSFTCWFKLSGTLLRTSPGCQVRI